MFQDRNAKLTKDHKGLYLCPPFNAGKQVKLDPGIKDAVSKSFWNVIKEGKKNELRNMERPGN